MENNTIKSINIGDAQLSERQLVEILLALSGKNTMLEVYDDIRKMAAEKPRAVPV